MSSNLPAVWLAALGAVAALNVSAQPAPTPPAPAAPAAAAPTTATNAAAAPAVSASMAAQSRAGKSGGYRSVFDGYQSFSEESVRPWKESNDTVRAVGGWRAYAKEAAETTGNDRAAPAPAGPASAARPGQAKP